MKQRRKNFEKARMKMKRIIDMDVGKLHPTALWSLAYRANWCGYTFDLLPDREMVQCHEWVWLKNKTDWIDYKLSSVEEATLLTIMYWF